MLVRQSHRADTIHIVDSYRLLMSSIGGSSTIPASSGFVASTYLRLVYGIIIYNRLFGQVSCSLVV
jgi:hypothetical protein